MVTNLLLVSFNFSKNERLRKNVKYFSLAGGYAIIKKLKILRRMIMCRENKKAKYSIRKTALATVSLAVGLVMVPVVSAEKIVYAEEDVAEATPAEAVEEIEENTGEIIDDAWLPAGAGEPDLAVDSIATKTTPANPVLTEVEDATSITQDEKDRVAIEIGKANPDLPEGTSVTVGIDGEVTFTYSDGSTNKIPGKYTIGLKGQTQPFQLEQPKAKEEAKRLPNTGVVTNNAVVAGLSILAVAALLAARRKNNK